MSQPNVPEKADEVHQVQTDPNDLAESLAKLCGEVTNDTNDTKDENSENRGATLEISVPEDPIVQNAEEGAWVDHDNDPNTPKIFIRGAKFGSESLKDDTRLESIVQANHVDQKRDDAIGIPLSRVNMNYIFAAPDERDKKFKAIYGAPSSKKLPTKVDLRDSLGPILDQQDLGSCVSNSLAYALRVCLTRQKLPIFSPSRLFIYYNARQIAEQPIYEDSGVTIRDGYRSVSKYSACSEDIWPYDVNQFTKKPPQECFDAPETYDSFRYITLDNDQNQIKKSLSEGYPVSFGAALFESFMSAEVAQTGIIPMPDQKTEQRLGGHAMTIVGYDDAKESFLVANSWGPNWGEKGCCWIPYKYIENDDISSDFWSARFFG